MLNDYAVARGLHVLAVVMWIGGVGFVTAVMLPALRQHVPVDAQYPLFEQLEHRFAAQARFWVALVLLTGALMLERTGGWGRLWSTWWLLVMASAWVPFALMLYVLEPLVVHRVLKQRAQLDPAGTMALVQLLHVVLLAWSVVSVLVGVVWAHGGW